MEIKSPAPITVSPSRAVPAVVPNPGKVTLALLVVILPDCVPVIVVVSPSKVVPAIVPKSLLKAVFLIKEGSPPKLLNEVAELVTSDKLLVETKSPVPGKGVAHVLSPLRNVVALGIPVADNDGVKLGSVAVPILNKFINVLLPTDRL